MIMFWVNLGKVQLLELPNKEKNHIFSNNTQWARIKKSTDQKTCENQFHEKKIFFMENIQF